MGQENRKRDKNAKLTWKDHVAFFVALIETVMVPAIVLIVILLILIVYSAIVR